LNKKNNNLEKFAEENKDNPKLKELNR